MSVKKGWQGMSEVNYVTYDEREVTAEQLTDWLKESGTYIRTVAQPSPDAEEK